MNLLRLLTCLLLLSYLLSIRPVFAQDSVQLFIRPALIKTNLVGPFSLFIEAPTASRQSLQVSAQRINFSLFNTSRIFNLTPEYRFYLSKIVPTARRPAPKGLYLSPYLKYRYVTDEIKSFFYSNTLYTVSYSMAGGGLVVGAQFINSWGFALDAFVGGGYFPLMSYSVSQENTAYRSAEPKPQDYRVDLRIGICIGLAVAKPH